MWIYPFRYLSSRIPASRFWSLCRPHLGRIPEKQFIFLVCSLHELKQWQTKASRISSTLSLLLWAQADEKFMTASNTLRKQNVWKTWNFHSQAFLFYSSCIIVFSSLLLLSHFLYPGYRNKTLYMANLNTIP